MATDGKLSKNLKSGFPVSEYRRLKTDVSDVNRNHFAD